MQGLCGGCCPAPSPAAVMGTAPQPEKRAAPAPCAGDLSQSCTWLLSLRISSRRCLITYKSNMPQPRRAGSFPRRGVEFQHLPFLFFGIRLTHMRDIELLVFLLVTRHQDSFQHNFLPKWILTLCSPVLMRNHLSVRVSNVGLDKIKNYFCPLPPP